MKMNKLVLLSLLLMLTLSACVTTPGTTRDFNKVFDDAPVDLRGQ